MHDLDKALADIGTIRSQLARDTAFHAYGPATVAATGLLAVLAAIVQSWWIPSPMVATQTYLLLWIGVAALAIALIGIEMVTRSRRLHSSLADEMIFNAVEQFLPTAVAGALLTMVIARCAPQGFSMLPGLWQILFGLGIFALSRALPRVVFWIGVWYLLSGLACVALTSGEYALSPWTMGLPFGFGQVFAAGLLYRGLRNGSAAGGQHVTE